MKFGKLITLILALSLIVASLVAIGVTASAEEAAPTIAHKNIYYDDYTSIAVQVDYEGALEAGAKLGIIVWDSANPDRTVESAIHKSFKLETLNGKSFYLTQPIEAGNMSYPYVIAAAIDNGDGTYTIGETEEYSLTKYAYEKLGEKNTVYNSAYLCQMLLKYAEAADSVIANTQAKLQVAYVSTVGGTVGNGYTTFGGVNGDTVILRADAKNAAGKYFASWTNAAGEVISTERVCQVTIPADAEAGAIVYTANYGDTADYYVIDIDSLAKGALVTPSASATPTNNVNSYGYNTLYPQYHFSIAKKWLNDELIATGIYEAVSNDDGTTYVHEGLASHIEVVNDHGDKEIRLWRDTAYDENGKITKQLFNPASIELKNRISNTEVRVKNANALSLDFKFVENNKTSATHFHAIYTCNADNSIDSNYRVNFNINTDGTVTIYGEGASYGTHYFISDTDKHGATDAKKYKLEAGTDLTVGYVINRENETLEVYLDGALFGTIPLSSFKGHSTNANFKVAESYIKYVSISAVRDEDAIIAVDNVIYANK